MKMLSVSLKGVSKLLSSRSKTKTSAVAIIALLTLSAVAAILPAAFAVARPDRNTGTYAMVAPKLVGLGQKVTVNILTYPAPSGPGWYAQDLVGKFGGFQNTSVTITKPDGTKETFMPVDASLEQIGIKIPGLQQIVGSLLFYYEPDQVGNYSITGSFPGQTYMTDGSPDTVYYKPSSSPTAFKFTVQEDPVLAGLLNGYPWSPLPTSFWQNPINVNNREWAAISGDWTIPFEYSSSPINAYNDYSTAPNTAHILWKTQTGSSGLIGGAWGSLPYGGAGSTQIVMDGKAYRNDAAGGTFSCIDLLTGEKLWNVTGSIRLGMHIDPFYQTAAQQNEGQIDKWIWDITSTSGQWKRFDPFTGALIQVMTNAPSSAELQTRFFQDGDPLCFITQRGNWNTTLRLKYAFENLIKWNFTKVTSNDWRTGIVWNVSIRQPDGIGVGDGRLSVTAYPYYEANTIVVRAHNDEEIMMGFDLTTGAHLWTVNNTVIDLYVGTPWCGPNGPIIMIDGVDNSFVAYSVKTGQEIWRTQVGELPQALLPSFAFVVHNNTFYTGCYDGHVYALDLDDGHIIWKSDYIGDSTEMVFNTKAFNGRTAGADGKLYFNTANVYSMMPRTRFQELVCIDEATGKFIWRLPIGPLAPRAIADGYLVATDGDNGMEYCIGKGKTATTVTAPLTAVSAGTGVLVQGTVMDMSPAAPNTPAVSDADMSVWMDYINGQNATLINNPPTPHGVPVQLTALSSSGTAFDLGTVTSDSSGHFATQWTPKDEGLYTVYATFAGSESYWSSYAETALSVGPAPETTTSQPPAAAPDNTMLLYGILAAVVVAILIGLVAIVLVLRKH